METRKPIVAGQFYPGQHDTCVDEINEFTDEIGVFESLPDTIVAGIVPHAGWAFSGKLAAMVFSAIKQQHDKVHTFIILGAAHSYFGQAPAAYASGSWVTPLGESFIDEEIARQLLASGAAVNDGYAHSSEHSIEVQIPMIQHLFAGAKILPIVVPPSEQAVLLGNALAEIISQSDKKIVCIGSTDLTHYGPRYGFTPVGTGSDALKWASAVNDKQFIDLALKLEPEQLMANSAENCNACGPGAAAAAVTVASKLGKTSGMLLAHTTSNKVMAERNAPTSSDCVGYAAIVI
jgi:AmmeMemoRadiSam system protein B